MSCGIAFAYFSKIRITPVPGNDSPTVIPKLGDTTLALQLGAIPARVK